ncbi:SPOCS domain-containing protein [Thermohalobacter berrensis]|uniref:Peptidoglycan-binding LysM n=1 Tax=Thermohalobacter berrensis TaxID=99594 RepID=A0A419T039_9FIRM|nr:SPOCS domain-containing protein [Thermohalobacter berrensis]RKD30914.1 peptidoglycan-binding LysM [Thermohalobacter berrensis]
MAVELVKDLLKIDQTVGKEEVQSLVEGEIVLPETKPDINKILTVDGEIDVRDIKVEKDKLIAKGIVKFKALYNTNNEEKPVSSVEASTDFSEEVEVLGIDENMKADVEADIEHIDYNLADTRKISVKTVLKLLGKVEKENTIDIVEDMQGDSGVQVLKEKIRYNDVVGANISNTIVKEAFELEEEMPDVVDILRVDTKAYERETKVVDDKVIVAGVVDCSIMYFGDDNENKINHVRHEIPFTHFVEINGATKDMDYSLKLNVGETSYDTREDINGNLRVIDVESVVKIDAKVYEQKVKEVIVDTYSTKRKFDVKKEKINIVEDVGRNQVKEEIKETITLEENNEEIKNIYDLKAKPILTDYRIIDGKVVVEGLLNLDMIYLGMDTEEIRNFKYEIPFKTYTDIEGVKEGMESEIDLALANMYFNKTNSKEIEIEADIKADVAVNRIKEIDIVTEAEEIEEEIDSTNRPSITVYIVQNDDTLWDIAKRYNTTVEDLIETNEIMNPDNIMPGEKLIIEKTVDIEL